MTEFNKIIEDLTKKYKELEYIINKSPAIVLLWKNEEGWPVEFVTDNISQFGYTKDEFMSGKLRYSEIIYPDDLDRVKEEVATYSEKKITEFTQEYRILNKSKEIIWIDDRTFVRRDDEGKITHFQGIILDITEKKKNQEELEKSRQNLKESQEKFKVIADQSLMGICIIQDFEIKYLNDQMAEIYGYTINEVEKWKPQEFIKVIHQDDREKVLDQIRKKQQSSKDVIIHYIAKIVKKDGKIRWVENYSKSIIYQGRSADLMTQIDITAKMNAEQKLRASEEKYREAFYRENFYKDLFMHDMKNILQAINSSLEIYEYKLKDEMRYTLEKKVLDNIHSQIDRGAHLINNIKRFSELESFELNLIKLNIYKIIQSDISNIQNSIKNQKIFIELLPRKDPEFFILGSELIHEMFENILLNSIIHNDNEKINISIVLFNVLKEQKPYIRIEISDNGRGIEDSRKDIIFNRAYNQDKSKIGMGLGLSLVKLIIEKFNGDIWIEDKVPGDNKQGSRFIILLPQIS